MLRPILITSFTALLAAGLAGLAGCDTLYGVERQQTLKTLPDLACVEDVIRSTPGVDRVTDRPGRAGAATSAPAAPPMAGEPAFMYRVAQPGLWGELQFVGDARAPGKVLLRQYFETLGGPPRQDVVDAIRPVMRRIEVGLANRCGIPELPAGVRETCKGVACPALPP